MKRDRAQILSSVGNPCTSRKADKVSGVIAPVPCGSKRAKKAASNG